MTAEFETSVILFLEFFFKCNTSDAQSIFEEHKRTIELAYINNKSGLDTARIIYKSEYLINNQLY